MSSLKQKIQEKIDELESENDRILQGVNEDCQLPDSQAQAILRSSYHNNGSIQGLKDALGLLDEATKQIKGIEKSVLEMFCQQGPPSKRWIQTTGEYWRGRNEAIREVLAVLVGGERE